MDSFDVIIAPKEYMTLLMRDQENIEKGRAEGIIETGVDFGLSDNEIIDRLQNKLNISLQMAWQYLEMFRKSL